MNDGHVTDIDNARLSLEAARRKVETEITSYPRPIAGCDAQFNHLLAARERISLALRALRDDDQAR
jgi:hypothetical protein